MLLKGANAICDEIGHIVGENGMERDLSEAVRNKIYQLEDKIVRHTPKY